MEVQRNTTNDDFCQKIGERAAPPRLYTGPIISLLTIEKELLAYQINQFGAMKHIVLYCGAL